MHFPTQWTAATIAALMLGLEPLTLGTGTANAASSHRSAPNLQVPATSVVGQEQPVLLARTEKQKIKKAKVRKPRTNSEPGRPASIVEVEQFLNVHRAGMNAVRGCVTNDYAPDCEQLVSSKSLLQNWCLQGKVEACYLFQTLSSQEAYQLTSDALLRSVR